MDGIWHIDNKAAFQSGVDYGNGSKPIQVVATRFEGERLTYAVVKIPGGHHWVERSLSHPGSYHVLQILEIHDIGVYRCVDLMDFPLRSGPKAR